MAAIAIPRFVGTQETARQRAEESTLQVVQSAIRLYQAESGKLPAATGALTVADFKAAYIGSALKAPTSTANSGKSISMDANGIVTYQTTAVTEIPFD